MYLQVQGQLQFSVKIGNHVWSLHFKECNTGVVQNANLAEGLGVREGELVVKSYLDFFSKSFQTREERFTSKRGGEMEKNKAKNATQTTIPDQQDQKREANA